MKIGKKVITSALVILVLLSFSVNITGANAQVPYKTLTPQETKTMINRNDFALIIDVRNITEYELGHLYNAVSMPLETLGNRTNNELQAYLNSNILVYCGVGGRSVQAAQILTDNNFTKVYTLMGGIVAWMQTGYQIYTSFNYISVDNSKNGKAIIDIEPYLLFQAECPCQNQTLPDTPNPVDPMLAPELTSNTTTKTDTNKLISATFDVDGIAYEMTYNRTLLWSYEKITGNCNRTAFLVSTEIMLLSEGVETLVARSYTLDFASRSDDYKVTLLADINDISEENYGQVATIVAYLPNGAVEPTVSKETIAFNSSITLFETFQLLSDVCKEVSKLYKHSEAPELVALDQGYRTMDNELNQFHNIAKQNLQSYNKPVLNSSATILDTICTYTCGADCGVIAGLFCTAVCIPTAALCGPLWPACLLGCEGLCNGGASVACTILCDYLCGEETNWDNMGCVFLCGAACSLCDVEPICFLGCGWFCELVCDKIRGGIPSVNAPTPITYYVASIAQTGTWGYGSVNNPNNLRYEQPDGYFVQLWGGNYGDGGQIVGYMNQVAHGDIWLYCYSGTGYYTHIYTYVSYNNNNDWTQTSVQTVYGDGTGAHWIKFGSYSGNFRYIAIAAIDDNGMSANIFIDAVNVVAY